MVTKKKQATANLTDKLQAKIQEAQIQRDAWQQVHAQAQEQIIRWDAILNACQKLLEDETDAATLGEHNQTEQNSVDA